MSKPGSAELQLGKKTPEKQDVSSSTHHVERQFHDLSAHKANDAELELGAPRNTLRVEPGNAPKGWYSRGHLPHFDAAGLHQHITYRLADSLPQSVLERIQTEIEAVDESQRDHERRRRIETYLDAGHGSCVLARPDAAECVIGAWRHFDGLRYDLLAWVVMPNHCHVLIRPYADQQLGRIVQSWKSYTARRIPRERRAPVRHASLWQREYWDRFIRDERHFTRTIAYIHENPVKAGLCENAVDWPWSSARPYAELELGAPGQGMTASPRLHTRLTTQETP